MGRWERLASWFIWKRGRQLPLAAAHKRMLWTSAPALWFQGTAWDLLIRFTTSDFYLYLGCLALSYLFRSIIWMEGCVSVARGMSHHKCHLQMRITQLTRCKSLAESHQETPAIADGVLFERSPWAPQSATTTSLNRGGGILCHPLDWHVLIWKFTVYWWVTCTRAQWS